MASAPVAGIATLAGLTLGVGAWSIDQLRRNDWNTRVILEGHARLGDSLPVGAAATVVGTGAGLLAARSISSRLATRIAAAGALTGFGAAAFGTALGVATMLGPGIPDDRRGDESLWRQQLFGWAGPTFVLGSVVGGTAALLSSAEGRALLHLAR